MKNKAKNRFLGMSYDDMLLLVEPEMFYKVVNQNNIEDFVVAFCFVCAKRIGLKCKPKVVIDCSGREEKGSQQDFCIYINKKYINMFELCKEKNLKSYSYDLACVIMHETQHVKQKEMLNDFVVGNKRNSFVCGGFSYFDDRVKKFRKIDTDLSLERSRGMKRAYEDRMNQWEETTCSIYDNSPHEVDANIMGISMLLDLYKISNNELTLCAIKSAVEDVDYAFEQGEWSFSSALNDEFCSERTKKVFKLFKEGNENLDIVKKEDVFDLFPEYVTASQMPTPKQYDKFLDDSDKFNEYFNNGCVSKGSMYDQLMSLLNGK